MATPSQNGTLPRTHQPIRVAQPPPPSSHHQQQQYSQNAYSNGTVNDSRPYFRQTSGAPQNARCAASTSSGTAFPPNGYANHVDFHQQKPFPSSQSMTTFPAVRQGQPAGTTSAVSNNVNSTNNNYQYQQQQQLKKLPTQNGKYQQYQTSNNNIKQLSASESHIPPSSQTTTTIPSSMMNGTSGGNNSRGTATGMVVERELTPTSGSSSTLLRQQRLAQMSYADILSYARQQQRNIEANEIHLDEDRRITASQFFSGSGGNRPKNGLTTNFDQNAKIQISSLRAQIARDEQELAQLGTLQRSARQLSTHNRYQNHELKQLEQAYSRDDDLLRKAIEKVDVLRKQLDLFYQRRAATASANDAAKQQQQQQKLMNGGNIGNELDRNQQYTPNGFDRIDNANNGGRTIQSSQQRNASYGNAVHQLQMQQASNSNQNRPKASVEPFIQRQIQNFEMKSSSGEGPVWRNAHNNRINSNDNYTSAGRAQMATQNGMLPEEGIVRFRTTPNGYHRPNGVNSGNYNGLSKKNALEDQQQVVRRRERMALPSSHHHHHSTAYSSNMHSSLYDKLIQPDQLSLPRGNSIASIKRRSWLSELSGESILRVVAEEQRKGRTHISFSDLHSPKIASSSSGTEPITESQSIKTTPEGTPKKNGAEKKVEEQKRREQKVEETPSSPVNKHIRIEASVKVENSSSPSNDNNSNESRQLAKQTSEKAIEKVKIEPNKEEGSIQKEPQTKVKYENNLSEEPTSVAHNALEKKILSPRSTILASQSQNCDIFNREFAQSDANKTAKSGKAEEFDSSNSLCSFSSEEEEEEVEEEEEEEVEEEEEEEAEQKPQQQQSPNKTVILRTVSLDNENKNSVVEKADEKQEETTHQTITLKNIEKEEPKSAVKEEAEEEEEESAEEGEEEEIHDELTIEAGGDGVTIEPLETSSPMESEDPSVDYISKQILGLFNTLEEPEQFFTLGDLGRFEISTSGGEIVTDDGSSTTTTEDILIDEESFQPVPGLKGILSKGNRDDSGNGRRVVFDKVVLFHDMAYAGQFDELVKLASQIDDVSVPNSQGITALHFATCTSQHQVVKFLIDINADINAQDQDGWGPLHCAASCNDLDMLKILVENGACPFALSHKWELPSDEFDRSLDCEEAIDYMELVEECMGVVNDKKVYAAFSYEAKRDDELTFEEGDELVVLRKCEQSAAQEHCRSRLDTNASWWLCERPKDGSRGLVPRNYLGLFPKKKFQGQYKVNIELSEGTRTIESAILSEGRNQNIPVDDGKITSPTKQHNMENNVVELSTYA